MIAAIRIALFLTVAGLSTGCLRMTYTLHLRPDGSGTIVQTIGMSKTAIAGFAAAIGGNAADITDATSTPGMSGVPFFKDAELKAAAAQMGEGVRFVSIAPASDGALDGQTATFAFDDIRKLKLDLRGMFLGGMGKDTLPDLPGEDVIGVTFVRENGRSVLVLDMPAIDEDMTAGAAGQKKDPAATPEPMPDVPPELQKMFQDMFKDFHVEIALNFDGTIIAADAPFVDGRKVTLLEMNFGELLKNANSAQELMQKIESMEPDNIDNLLTMPGLKVATQRKLRIEFR